MSDHYAWGIVMIVIVVGYLYCITGSWRCYLGFHNTFVNTPFDEIGNVGESTLRCHRCYKDVKNLGYPNEK